jgi:transposase
MKRSSSPTLLFKNLNLRPLHPTLWKNLHLQRAGRPVEYDPECDLHALMLRHLEQIPYIKDLVKRLKRYKEMRSACGYGEKVPTEAHFSQMKRQVGAQGFRAIEQWLRHEALRLRESQPLSAVGLVQAACILLGLLSVISPEKEKNNP